MSDFVEKNLTISDLAFEYGKRIEDMAVSEHRAYSGDEQGSADFLFHKAANIIQQAINESKTGEK